MVAKNTVLPLTILFCELWFVIDSQKEKLLVDIGYLKSTFVNPIEISDEIFPLIFSRKAITAEKMKFFINDFLSKCD